MSKGQKRNAYFYFMLEYKRKQEARGRKFPGGMKDIQCDPKCSEAWNMMTPQQKGPYASMAKNDRIAAQGSMSKMTCTGELLSDLEKREEAKQLFYTTMTAYIKSTVPVGTEYEKLSTLKFYFIHASYFYMTQISSEKFDYFPAEFAVVEFSLEGGVGDVYHEIINANIPIGFAREAMETSQQSHQIPLNLADGEKNFLVMYNKLVAFLQERMTGSKFPPLFVTDAVSEVVKSLLQRMTDAADVDPDTFLIYSLDMLFTELLNAANAKENVTLPLVAGKNEFAKDLFAYQPGLECEFHKSLDGTMVYCSMAIVKRWGFVICDYCWGFMQTVKIPGKHCPLETNCNVDDLDATLAQLTLGNLKPMPSIASMSGVTVEHRIRASERSHKDEQARRNLSTPILIIDHSKDDKAIQVLSTSTAPVCERPLRIPKTKSLAMAGVQNPVRKDIDQNFPLLGARGPSRPDPGSSYAKPSTGKGRGCF